MRDDYFQSNTVKYKAKYIKYLGERDGNVGLSRLCNLCGYRFSAFLDFNNRKEIRCPICGSLERHRHLAVHLFSLLPFLQKKKILHFAPEPVIKNILLSSEAEYYDADLNEKNASFCIDMTSIDFEDNFFDYVLAMHVLEHIVDDRLALKNVFRVLRPGGTAILSVPLFKESIERPEATTPEERRLLFGHECHVRKYDYNTFYAILNDTGFRLKVSKDTAFPRFYRNEVNLRETIFFAQKPK